MHAGSLRPKIWQVLPISDIGTCKHPAFVKMIELKAKLDKSIDQNVEYIDNGKQYRAACNHNDQISAKIRKLGDDAYLIYIVLQGSLSTFVDYRNDEAYLEYEGKGNWFNIRELREMS